MNEPIREETETTQFSLTPADQQHENEKQAFVRHVQDQGEQIPENFEDAGSWFDSLKNAQSAYTQGRQEIADLKQQYNENGVENPNYNPDSTQAPATPEAEETLDNVESLRITQPVEADTEETQPLMEPPVEVSVGEWNDWGNIIDASGGDVPDSLRNAIKSRLNIDDKIIDDYMSQRQARTQQNVDNAANLVGGQQELNKLMSWSAENLSEDERVAVNGQLAGPGYKTAILGLKARYETSDNVSAAKGREPGATLNRTASVNTYQSITPYSSNQEMFADQRNPRYKTDAKFRSAVEERILATNQFGFRT